MAVVIDYSQRLSLTITEWIQVSVVDVFVDEVESMCSDKLELQKAVATTRRSVLCQASCPSSAKPSTSTREQQLLGHMDS